MIDLHLVSVLTETEDCGESVVFCLVGVVLSLIYSSYTGAV